MNLLSEYGWETFINIQKKSVSDIRHDNSYISGTGRVITQYGKYYSVALQRGIKKAVLAGSLHYAGTQAAVGDWVSCDSGDTCVIKEILPRYGIVSRKVPGEETTEQILAANVDVIFVVIGMDDNYRVSRVERYLTAAYESGASPVILLNKSDLLTPEEIAVRQVEIEEIAFGIPVCPVSAAENFGFEEIYTNLGEGQTAVFLGSSGVGKSSIVNCLLQSQVQKTNETREADGKGKHTTTRRELFLLPEGGIVIDTPGLRELQLWSAGDTEPMKGAFADIEAAAERCKFRDCSHINEPGCAVRDAIASGEIGEKHFQNYLKMRKELAWLGRRQDERAAREEALKFAKMYREGMENVKRKRGGL